MVVADSVPTTVQGRPRVHRVPHVAHRGSPGPGASARVGPPHPEGPHLQEPGPEPASGLLSQGPAGVLGLPEHCLRLVRARCSAQCLQPQRQGGATVAFSSSLLRATQSNFLAFPVLCLLYEVTS